MNKQTFKFGNLTFTIEVEEQKPQTCACERNVQAPREPDGIVVDVARPRREAYAYGWNGTVAFESDMKKYRNLEKAAKACDWDNETMKEAAQRPTREVRWKDGIVPLGAVVVDHTFFGEPIFEI